MTMVFAGGTINTLSEKCQSRAPASSSERPGEVLDTQTLLAVMAEERKDQQIHIARTAATYGTANKRRQVEDGVSDGQTLLRRCLLEHADQ